VDRLIAILIECVDCWGVETMAKQYSLDFKNTRSIQLVLIKWQYS